MRDPETPAEWQEAVDIATAARALTDAKMYGLIDGGPEFDVLRCDQIIRMGRERGIVPSASDVDLAVAMVRELASAETLARE